MEIEIINVLDAATSILGIDWKSKGTFLQTHRFTARAASNPQRYEGVPANTADIIRLGFHRAGIEVQGKPFVRIGEDGPIGELSYLPQDSSTLLGLTIKKNEAASFIGLKDKLIRTVQEAETGYQNALEKTRLKITEKQALTPAGKAKNEKLLLESLDRISSNFIWEPTVRALDYINIKGRLQKAPKGYNEEGYVQAVYYGFVEAGMDIMDTHGTPHGRRRTCLYPFSLGYFLQKSFEMNILYKDIPTVLAREPLVKQTLTNTFE